MNITYRENALNAKLFNALKASVGLAARDEAQVQRAIEGGLYSVVAECGGQAVGMGRLVGDGAMYCYIQDMVIAPAYQHRGIGGTIVDMLLAYVKHHGIPSTRVTVGLLAAKGKEAFYEKHGFIPRPNDAYGAGMIRCIDT